MLAELPFDVQLHVMDHLDRKALYHTCLATRKLNEAASRILYVKPTWSGSCCEQTDDRVCHIYLYKVYERLLTLFTRR